jgi:hypothetical protein
VVDADGDTAAAAPAGPAPGTADGDGGAAAAPPPPQPMSPPPSKRTPRARAPPNGADAAPWAAAPPQPLSDADYLAALSRQQQSAGKQAAGSSAFAAPPPHPSSSFAFAADALGPHHAHSPLGPRPTGLRSPHLGMAAAAGAGAAMLAALQDAAGAGAAPGANPYLVGLPSRRGGLAGAGRRGSLGTELPQRLTPLAESAPEPRQVPLHVAAAARDVMTGARVAD